MNVDFESFFRFVTMPVLVYDWKEKQGIVYENPQLQLWFNPLFEQLGSGQSAQSLLGIPQADFDQLEAMTVAQGAVAGFSTTVRQYSGAECSASISSSLLSEGYIALFVLLRERESRASADVLLTAFTSAYQAPTAEEAICRVLAVMGRAVRASRSYIFEPVSELEISNTFEWCAPGVEPMKSQLQGMSKEETGYDGIMSQGVSITDDIRALPETERRLLELQGIKALALIPILSLQGAMGYVGFDDCETCRVWSNEEIQLLREGADILASFLGRRDIERKLNFSMEQLEIMASTDQMTKAYNRAWGERVIHRIQQEPVPQESCVAFVDVDNLKAMNDKYGHVAGDEMIIELVTIMRECTRKSDAVCRWGGDEFVLILRGTAQQATYVMDKIQSHVTVANHASACPFKLSFSYGIATIRQGEGQTVDDVIHEADQAMYRNKGVTKQ